MAKPGLGPINAPPIVARRLAHRSARVMPGLLTIEAWEASARTWMRMIADEAPDDVATWLREQAGLPEREG